MDSKEGSTVKAGVFGIGLEVYRSQLDGLKERLEGYRRYAKERLGRWARVVSPGWSTPCRRRVFARTYFEHRQH